ncbi:spike base protein, RCAP_Rcc01079 family [Sphingomonas sp. GB1N7]|uniref:spike base protein, RCAP_Rcc01079 family n=1 Tax=Parasphingomonas caseinilytica TaxID=3096158 RepID=UPI002FCA03C1
MADSFANSADQVSAPATRAVAVVPHDTNALGDVPKALYVGTGGDIAARGVGGGADVVFRNVAPGSVLPFRAAFVRATGTSAADLIALY